MRVITGTARGAILSAPDGLDTRPTGDKVKESIFSIIQFDVPGARVLDLFAGSGQLGIEALSRGAESAVFVEKNPIAVKCIESNLEKTKLKEGATVVRQHALSFLQSTSHVFDIAILDPPYMSSNLNDALPLLAEHMSQDGMILCETAMDHEMPEKFENFALKKEYRYGKTKLYLYTVGEGNEE